MLYRSLFPRDVRMELERLQREMQQSLETSPSIRGVTRGGFPAINIGNAEKSVEIDVYVPGVSPSAIDVQLEKGVLTISGDRPSILPPPDAPATAHIDERFFGRFRRVISLPDDVDTNAVQAKYRDGVLHISIQRQEAVLPRRIDIH